MRVRVGHADLLHRTGAGREVGGRGQVCVLPAADRHVHLRPGTVVLHEHRCRGSHEQESYSHLKEYSEYQLTRQDILQGGPLGCTLPFVDIKL